MHQAHCKHGILLQDEMIKQRAVIAGASEVRRILQGGNTSRPAPPPSASSIPPPDRVSGFISGAAQTMQAPIQMQQSMPTQHGHFVPQVGPPQQPPEMAQTVPLYIAVEAPPHFDLHGRLRGPGELASLWKMTVNRLSVLVIR